MASGGRGGTRSSGQSAMDAEEETSVFVYDRREGDYPERKIQLGGIFKFESFKARIREVFELKNDEEFVVVTTNREEIKDTKTYDKLIEDGDTLYILNTVDQELAAPTQERIDYLPHYDTLVKSGMYEYYASEGQNPLPYAFAELIDNALAATADNVGDRNIELRIILDDRIEGGKHCICVLDNGHGMTSKDLNDWAVYRLSKFNRKDRKRSTGGAAQSAPQVTVDTRTRAEPTAGESELGFWRPRSLNSEISYFGVGGKQAVFFIGTTTRMITKPKNSKDVHELVISQEDFEKKEKNKEKIYSGYIRNRKPGDTSHISAEEDHIRKIITEETGRENFTAVVVTNVNTVHLKFLKDYMKYWPKQLSHIYHYYLHGPQGNTAATGGGKSARCDSPSQHIHIQIKLIQMGRKEKIVDLRELQDDMQTQYIQKSADSFEFKATVEGTGIVEGILRYHPFLYDRETYPADMYAPPVVEEDEEDCVSTDRPARGKRPIFECYWNGRLIPYTFVDDFEWCSPPKKRGVIPVECYNRISGCLFTNDKFQVSTNKLTFMDLEVRLKDKNTTYSMVKLGQEQRAKIDRQFFEWLKECHEKYDKQVKFCGFGGSITRPELASKKQQAPWAVFKSIEWDGKVFKEGQLVRTQRTVPIIYGTIQRFLLHGDYEGEVFATGGEMEMRQEPSSLYDEVKVLHLSKLDRSTTKLQAKKYIEEEEAKLPDKVVVKWPEGDSLQNNDKIPAGRTIGAMKVEIFNRKGEAINRLPGGSGPGSAGSRKLLVELKIIWHSPSGDSIIVSHISQHGGRWPYWFRKMENVKNLGKHTLRLQVVMNESDNTVFAGKELPSLNIKFTVTEAAPDKFTVGLMDPPFQVGQPFQIPLELQDEFGHPTSATNKLQPVLEASGLDLTYEGTETKGTTLIIKRVTALGDVGSHQGKNFNLKVTLPGLEEDTQVLKIRLLPGPPSSLHVKPSDDSLQVENGKELSFDVEVRDKAGNISTQPKLDVTCKFTGCSGLPTYSVDCSNTGRGVLTGDVIQVRNMKKEQSLRAIISCPSFKGIPAIEKKVVVTPSTRASTLELSYMDPETTVQVRHQANVTCTAGETLDGLTFTVFDEASRVLPITESMAAKIKVNWTPRLNTKELLKGNLPAIKVPLSVAETKYCQVNLHDHYPIELGFTIRPQAGEVTHLRCTCTGEQVVRYGEKLQGDIHIAVVDTHGNPTKLTQGGLKYLNVEAEGLDTSACSRALGEKSDHFVLKNIRFHSEGPLGTKELCVTWQDLQEFVRLVLVPGPPAGIEVIDWQDDGPLMVYNGTQFDKPLVVQLIDAAGNPSQESGVAVQLDKDKGLELTPAPQSVKTDASGRANFGIMAASGKKGDYEFRPKAQIGKKTIEGPTLTVMIVPDPTKPVAVNVEYNRNAVYIAGDKLTEFVVSICAEDDSVITEVPISNVRMKVWKQDGPQLLKRPPPVAFVFDPDPIKESDKKGHFYFRDRRVPEKSGIHNIMFQYNVSRQDIIYSNLIAINVQPGAPVKLAPEAAPGTPTVSNTARSASRTLVRQLKLILKDQYDNPAGEHVNGEVVVKVTGEETQEEEVPQMVGGTKEMTVELVRGVALVQNVTMQQNSPGRDGQQYFLQCRPKSLQLSRTNPIPAFNLSFMFYNNVRKQEEMANLTREKDALLQTIRTYKQLFDTTQQLISEMKISVHEAKQSEQSLRMELRNQAVPASCLESIEKVDELLGMRMQERDETLNSPRRQCGLNPAPKGDQEIMGKIGHLALVEDDDIARVLSWHMASDMDCVVTVTTAKAKQVYTGSHGRQQVLPLDSIYRRNLPDWNRPLPHLRGNRSNFVTKGNPVYARDMLIFPQDPDNCKLVFGMLLGETVILDTLDDANAYRQEVVKITHCPTLLTRSGDRIRSNGKFGGVQNKAIPVEKMKGAIFGAPLPLAYHALCTQIDTLEKYREAMIKRINAEDDLNFQLETEELPEKQQQRRELQEAQEQFRDIEKRLGLKPTNFGSPPTSTERRTRTTNNVRSQPPPPYENESPPKRLRSNNRDSPSTVNGYGSSSGSDTPTRTSARRAAMAASAADIPVIKKQRR
ncbi:SMCHD1 [Branchiostoma lanceolatum]|uniref:SMCHD1 protein n=1 Tax=Branchiostoma lanceolatum TaxID=7740 RepID=A0A8J9Z5G6_BRALA|nr:SMCHD1 [Branchiostoma lanceolatum]